MKLESHPLAQGVFVKKLIKAFLRNCLVHPFILCNYRLNILGLKEALGSVEGAIVATNHISFMDGPLLVSMVWPIPLRGMVWHEEYSRWYQWPFFRLFESISVGSPKHLPDAARLARKEKAMSLVIAALANGEHVAISPEGGISDGTGVKITPHFSGLYELLSAHPKAPLVLLTLTGLQHSLFGRSKERFRPWWKRLRVSASFQTVRNVSLKGGPVGLNHRLEQYYNQGIPLATTKA